MSLQTHAHAPVLVAGCDPFALLLAPESVFFAMEHSDRLQRLQRRICRPLDKPVIPHELSEIEAYDLAIDADPGEAA